MIVGFGKAQNASVVMVCFILRANKYLPIALLGSFITELKCRSIWMLATLAIILLALILYTFGLEQRARMP